MEDRVRTQIVRDPINFQSLHDWAKHPRSGAIVTFSGITRDSFEGKHVKRLSYDCYVPRAELTLNKIAETALKFRKGINKVALIHRIGEVPLSQESVWIVVSSSHRREGWETAEWMLEEVKRTVEIWKLEVYDDDSTQWVEGCAHDHKHQH